MATIALYAGKMNQVPGLVSGIRKSVTDYKSELSAMRTKALQINQNICDLSSVITSIQAASQIQDQKADSLEVFQKNSERFIEDVTQIDKNVADVINFRKDDFYDKHRYLKPECEKSGWEKFCDGCKKAGEWCGEHWKSICKIVVAVVVIAAIGIASVLTGGVLAVILAGAFWGALAGGILGGVMGGITNAVNGGSFFDGFADGAFSGALTGAITGAACAGIGALGAILGKGIKCASTLGKIIKVTSKVTRVISLGLDGFDIIAMGVGLFDPSNLLVEINSRLHTSALYNGFQIGVNALAIFTTAASSTMKCFVAGTLVLTAMGLVAIENIKAGDRVIATDADTFETAEKTVLETYIRRTTELVDLTINGELIRTTPDHPFYVKDVGFVPAGKLYIGDKLLDPAGKILVVEDYKFENAAEPIVVYNFQVEDFHTYYAGNIGILVHNGVYDTKPEVSDPKMQRIVDDLYKGQNGKNVIGNGTTMDAVRSELSTGMPTHGKFHLQKAKDYANALKRILRRNDVSASDKIIANGLLDDILNAIAGK